MTHWQTTLAGVMTALGAALAKQDGWIGWIGQGFEMAGPLLLGLAAADANKVVKK